MSKGSNIDDAVMCEIARASMNNMMVLARHTKTTHGFLDATTQVIAMLLRYSDVDRDKFWASMREHCDNCERQISEAQTKKDQVQAILAAMGAITLPLDD